MELREAACGNDSTGLLLPLQQIKEIVTIL
jgi:hypothetical protein